MKKNQIILLLISICVLNSIYPLWSQEDISALDLIEMSLEDLLNLTVSSASGVEERLKDAPSTMIVINAEEIRRRGYTDIPEVIQDLPGFDITIANGPYYMYAYQRGYRTPITQRTLLLIDGKEDNNLWSQASNISRQYPMNHIDRIEVLYGPASALYGSNAFLGVVNIITKDGKKLEPGNNNTSVNYHFGSFNTVAVDFNTSGNSNNVAYSLGARYYKSDEPDYSDRWEFLSNDKLSNSSYWGPLLDIENNGNKLGAYYDPSDNWGLFTNFSLKGLKAGAFIWSVDEGYGTVYPADRAQVNGNWIKTSQQIYLENESDPGKDLRSYTRLIYRKSCIGGDWAEAEPDWNAGMENYSYISFTYWNVICFAYSAMQNLEFNLGENLLFKAGINYERKILTKAYDVPGYWGAFSSSIPNSETGPYGFGFGIGHSTDTSYTAPPPPNPVMPADNMTNTNDLGGFFQNIIDVNRFRFHMGIRYDYNSVYGSSVNPRISSIFRINPQSCIKMTYGEAFQEPSPRQLWGGWAGLEANPDLKPEKVQHVEAVVMYQSKRLLHDVSLFYDSYKNVIKEEAENAGKRQVYGAEYRLMFNLNNPLSESLKIQGFANYTYVMTKSHIIWDPVSSSWVDGEAEVGDIAPHKVHFGINWPVKKNLNFYINSSYNSTKELYMRNPIRLRGEKLDANIVLNTTIRYNYKLFTFGLKVNNILNNEYYHSGVESANAGDDFNNRSTGWYNSLIPAPGRSLMFILGINLE